MFIYRRTKFRYSLKVFNNQAQLSPYIGFIGFMVAFFFFNQSVESIYEPQRLEKKIVIIVIQQINKIKDKITASYCSF